MQSSYNFFLEKATKKFIRYIYFQFSTPLGLVLSYGEAGSCLCLCYLFRQVTSA